MKKLHELHVERARAAAGKTVRAFLTLALVVALAPRTAYGAPDDAAVSEAFSAADAAAAATADAAAAAAPSAADAVFAGEPSCPAGQQDAGLLANEQGDASLSWDVSVAQDASVLAMLIENAPAATPGEVLSDVSAAPTYTLTFQGTGAVRDFLSAAELPYAALASGITRVVAQEGITELGSFSCALENAVSFQGGTSLASLHSNVFFQAKSLVELDFSNAAIAQADPLAFNFSCAAGEQQPKRSIYVTNAASAQAVQEALLPYADSTALAITNGGVLAQGYQPQEGIVELPFKEGFTFSTWTSDEYLKHPASAWMPLSKYLLYARFVEIAQVTDPEPYEGYQGLDQTVTLYDPNQLPSTVVNPDILFLGESSASYKNQFQTSFNGYRNIQFAFGMGRGNNANGGDGSYQLSFALPYISVLDSQGNVVADYDNGNGLLRLQGIVFDGSMDKTTGYSIYAVRLLIAAQTLPEGTYTLRFGAGMGANNGISFLGKDVDFSFTVAYPQAYELQYSYNSANATAQVEGVQVLATQAVDVEIPATTEGADGKTYQVTSVGQRAFAQQGLVRLVDVPASVTSVGSEAFSQMSALEKVTVRTQATQNSPDSDSSETVAASTSTACPQWGSEVFAESAACVLYGYESSSCRETAALYENVTFAPLDDGIYANYVAVLPEGEISLSPAEPALHFTIMKDGSEVTSLYRAYLTNNRIASHEGTGPYAWNTIQGTRNGTTNLEIVSLADGTKALLTLHAQGFSEQASTEPTALSGYQGNGSTVALLGAGPLTTIDFDETLTCFSNTLVNPVPVVGAEFTLDLAGPGAAWGPTHSGWNWAGFIKNAESNLRIEDSAGKTVATLGAGLTWKTLTTSNTITVSVDAGVLEPQKQYCLVADAGFSGHNAQATLMKAVKWSFWATPANIASARISDIPAQRFENVPATPQVEVVLPGYSRKLWNEETGQVDVVTVPDTPLVQGEDFELSYQQNDAPGVAKALVSGTGLWSGTVVKEFALYGKGDVNMNGHLNAVDAQIAYDIACGRYSDLPNYDLLRENANVSGEDETVDAADAFAIQYAALFGWEQ